MPAFIVDTQMELIRCMTDLECDDQIPERLQKALVRMMRLRDSGNLEGARQQIRDVLAVEVIPKFRREAEDLLEHRIV
jgi:DUSAM domain-containing protein